MRDDPTLIFTLKAISPYAAKVFKDAHNERYWIPQCHLDTEGAASQGSTPVTNLGDEDSFEGREPIIEDFSDELRFTFDRKPRNIEQGFVFGSNPKICDVLIGNPRGGVSGSHLRITFDNEDRLVLIDSSTHGTAVSYNGQARKEKRNSLSSRACTKSRDRSNEFKWILFPTIESIRVIIGENIESLPKAPIMEFSVEVAEPQTKCGRERHEELKNTFLVELRTTIPFGFSIDNHSTTAGHTGLQSPTQRAKQRPIWIDGKEIGSGEFGTVYQAHDVSTGVAYAAKTFLRNGDNFQERWNREIAILQKMSHVRI